VGNLQRSLLALSTPHWFSEFFHLSPAFSFPVLTTRIFFCSASTNPPPRTCFASPSFPTSSFFILFFFREALYSIFWLFLLFFSARSSTRSRPSFFFSCPFPHESWTLFNPESPVVCSPRATRKKPLRPPPVPPPSFLLACLKLSHAPALRAAN